MPLERLGDWIQTYTGVVFYLLDPRVEDIKIEDIAHALSNLCRFGGHCKQFYSVAQHSVLVSCQVPAEDALWGLMHDASEAYLCDLPRPIKRFSCLGTDYKAIESDLMKVICKRFNLPEEMPASVEKADTDLLMTEKRDLMHGCNKPWEDVGEELRETIISARPSVAERVFLGRFNYLTR